ncbi:hypothetical protein ENSA7_66230 [Enhygromyxa salina]|uniref:Uncharacterized protein n=1 Tax=Enhygromyxa salina TaxID=215803 RepID=A0A2S9XZ54_9BACT|nr:hypothetical protein ENSA7_66230 [Enhygromyxa salina]
MAAARGDRVDQRPARGLARATRPPRTQLRAQLEPRAVEPELRVRLTDLDERRELLVGELQHDLGQLGDARGRLGVTEVGLDRAHDDGLIAATKQLAQRRDPDLVGQGRAIGGVLDVADVRGLELGLGQRSPHGRDAHAVARGHEALGPAAVAGRGPTDHREQLVAVAHRRVEGLEQDRAHALGRQVAIARAIAATAGLAAEQAHLRERDVLVRVNRQIDAARDRELGLTAEQIDAGEVDGHRRRRAHAVDRQARPLETKKVRHAVGDQVVGGRGRQRRARGVGSLWTVELARRAHVHTHPTAIALVERGLGHAAALEQVPRRGQEQALLRIHHRRFARRDPEEQWIEAVDAIEKAPPPLAVSSRPGPALGGNLGDAVLARAEVGPKLVEIGGLGIAAADPDDRHGL